MTDLQQDVEHTEPAKVLGERESRVAQPTQSLTMDGTGEEKSLQVTNSPVSHPVRRGPGPRPEENHLPEVKIQF